MNRVSAFIAISIIIVWSLLSIFILITYQLFMSGFIPIFSHKDRKPPSKPTNHFIGRYLFDTLFSYWHWVIIGNIGTPFWNVCVIYCNDKYFDSINSPIFMLMTFYWVSMIEFISSTKIKNNTEEEPFRILEAFWGREQVEIQENAW